MSYLKTAILMAGLTALLMAVGYAIGGTQWMFMAFIVAAVMNFFTYWYSDKMVLAMTHAQEVGASGGAGASRHDAAADRTGRAADAAPVRGAGPDAERICQSRNPEHAAVAVNEGLLNILNTDEVEGVIAHEIGHIKNRDILISTIAATLAGALTMLAHGLQYSLMFGGYGGRDDDGEGTNPLGALLMVIVAPIAAMIIQMAISRSREYAADETGGRLCGRPMSLANALLKLERGNEVIPSHANPATAHMYIVNPLHGGFASLFSTHPATADRVARLEALAHQLGSAPRGRVAAGGGLV